MTILWIPAAVVGLLLPVFLSAQAEPVTKSSNTTSQEPPVFDSRTADFERHVVTHGATVWLGKSRNRIQNFAEVNTTAGAINMDHRTTTNYEEDTLRREFSVTLDTLDSSSVTAEARLRAVKRYSESSGFLDYVLETKTGIDGITTDPRGYETIIAATVVTSERADTTWILRTESIVDYASSASERRGSLENGLRSIRIVDHRSAARGIIPIPAPRIPAPDLTIEFIENEELLGAVGDGVYLFSKDLDPDLKLVLAATMEILTFSHWQ